MQGQGAKEDAFSTNNELLDKYQKSFSFEDGVGKEAKEEKLQGRRTGGPFPAPNQRPPERPELPSYLDTGCSHI